MLHTVQSFKTLHQTHKSTVFHEKEEQSPNGVEGRDDCCELKNRNEGHEITFFLNDNSK